jgi:hypothetical protein
MKADVRSEHSELVRYFLGELAPEEQERLEERYMLDEEYAELRDQVELDLVDAYVSDALAPLEQEHFEQRYLITPKRKEAVHAAYLSKVYRDRIAEPESRALTGRTSLSPRRWLIPAMAAALVLVILGSALWLLSHQRPASHEAKSRAPTQSSSPKEETVPLPLQPAPVATPSPSQLAKHRPPFRHNPAPPSGVDTLHYEPLPVPALVIGEPVPVPTVVLGQVNADAVKTNAQQLLGANVNISAGMSELLMRRIQDRGKVHVEKDASHQDSTAGEYRLDVNILKLGSSDPSDSAPKNLGPFGSRNPGTMLGRFGQDDNSDPLLVFQTVLINTKTGRKVMSWSSAGRQHPLFELYPWVPPGADKQVDMTSPEFLKSDIGRAFFRACDGIAWNLDTLIKMDTERVPKK